MRPLLITDTSVLLNLLASEVFERIALDAGWEFVICEAAAKEALKLLNPQSGEMEPLHLEPLIASRILNLVTLDETTESQLYVTYAEIMGDGEAMSFAIAETRHLTIATDDQKAIKRVSRLGFSSPIIGTVDLLGEWQTTAGISMKEMGGILQLIDTRAHFRLGASHPKWDWLQSCLKAL